MIYSCQTFLVNSQMLSNQHLAYSFYLPIFILMQSIHQVNNVFYIFKFNEIQVCLSQMDNGSLFRIIIMSKKEKRIYPQKPSLAVFKQNLRSRTAQNPQKHIQKHECTGMKSVKNGMSNFATAVSTPQNRNQNSDQQRRINWLKYNILVGIYENWIRLYPFIEYLLHKNTVRSGLNDIQKFGNTKNAGRQKLKQQKQNKGYLKEAQVKELFTSLKNKHFELLSKFQNKEALSDLQNIQMMNKFQKLTRQLLSQFSLLNQRQIQTPKLLTQQVIHSINQQDFVVGNCYQIFTNNIKERLQFVQKMQQNYKTIIDKQQKRALHQKIEKAKRPLNIINKLKDNISMETLLEQLWLNMKNRKQNEDKRVQRQAIKKARPQKFAILGVGNRLKANYKFNKSQYYNQSYIQKKSRTRFTKGQISCVKTQYEESLGIRKQDLNPVQQENEQESFKPASNLLNNKTSRQQINQAQLDGCVHRQITKQIFPLNQNQTTALSRTKAFKLQTMSSSQQREAVQIQHSQILPRSTASPSIRIIERQRKSSIVKRGSFRRNRNIECQQESRQEHFSRFKANKKGPTVKHIRLHQSKYGRNASEIQQSQLIITNKERKRGTEEIFKKNNIRRGNFSKKLQQKQYVQIQPSFEQEFSVFQNGNFINQKKQIINYIRKIKTKGFLNQEKYKMIRVQTEDLLQRCSPSSLLQTHQFAKKMVQKTLQFTVQIPPSKQDCFSFLSDLRQAISKDEQIEMKIKQQLKIYFQESLSYIPEKQRSSNQKIVLNQTEIRQLNYQLRRIMQFKSQNQQIALAKVLMKFNSNLTQIPTHSAYNQMIEDKR